MRIYNRIITCRVFFNIKCLLYLDIIHIYLSILLLYNITYYPVNITLSATTNPTLQTRCCPSQFTQSYLALSTLHCPALSTISSFVNTTLPSIGSTTFSYIVNIILASLVKLTLPRIGYTTLSYIVNNTLSIGGS